MATKQELRDVKEELQAAIADTKQEFLARLENYATKDDMEKLELRLRAELATQAAKYQRLLFAVAALIVGLNKLLDVLFG